MADIAEPVLAGHLRLWPGYDPGEFCREFADRARGATADVERPECSGYRIGGPPHGRQVGPRHVADVHKIAELRTILEDRGMSPRARAERKIAATPA